MNSDQKGAELSDMGPYPDQAQHFVRHDLGSN